MTDTPNLDDVLASLSLADNEQLVLMARRAKMQGARGDLAKIELRTRVLEEQKESAKDPVDLKSTDLPQLLHWRAREITKLTPDPGLVSSLESRITKLENALRKADPVDLTTSDLDALHRWYMRESRLFTKSQDTVDALQKRGDEVVAVLRAQPAPKTDIEIMRDTTAALEARLAKLEGK